MIRDQPQAGGQTIVEERLYKWISTLSDCIVRKKGGVGAMNKERNIFLRGDKDI